MGQVNRGQDDSRFGGYRLPLVTIILVSGWDGYQWLPEFQTEGGYRLPLVTIISVSEWLSLTTGYQISHQWLPIVKDKFIKVLVVN